MRFWIALLLTLPARAEVLFRAPGAPPLEYRAALKADGDLRAPGDWYRKQHPVGARKDQLLDLFAEAQKAFVSGVDAGPKLLKVAELARADDWSSTERAVLAIAYLRLAQLETEEEARDRWLAASLNLGDDTFDASLFPPPLLARRTKLRGEMPRAEIPESLWREGWNLVLINGVACDADACVAPVRGPENVRVTYLSDTWLPVTKELNGDELAVTRPEQTAWLSGACERPNFHPAADRIADRRAFFGADCEAPPLRLAPVARANAQELKLPDIPSKPVPLYKNKWVWIGVGVVAAAIVMSRQKKETEREPTTTYGIR
ncbi:MAG TPA: hypothetical protein PKC28_05775 [Bdellovibrionales bacterium]|nr:hypothetical protein [Bdellovibrionales bacterium]